MDLPMVTPGGEEKGLDAIKLYARAARQKGRRAEGDEDGQKAEGSGQREEAERQKGSKAEGDGRSVPESH
jgi:hypothetical protein